MKKGFGTYIAALFVCISIFLSGTTAYAAAGNTAAYSTTPLEEAKFILKAYYVENLPEQAKSAATIDELIDIIGDPYTTYMSPEALQQFIDSIDNDFTGIGVTVEQVEDGVLILSVLKGSGAEEVGLKPGDIILEADNRVLKGMELSKALTYVKGKEGTFVNLKIKRDTQQFTVRVKRSKLELPTVEGEMLDGNIGYIRISSFGSDTDEELEEYLRKFESQNPTAYIIDIRSNGGGYVDTALEIAGYFIGNNVAMLTSNRWGVEQYSAFSDDIKIDRPVFLLVDMYSASASEILAGALQDYGKALLVGTSTYGKGTMQTLFPLSNEGALKVTTNYTYTPSGRSFNSVGLQPDVGTGEEGDPYYAALLLLNGDAEKQKSKEGYIALEIRKTLYDIDLRQARQDEYWESYGALIKDALQHKRKILIGTSEGWKPLEQQSAFHCYYYPDYKELPLLSDIEPNKVFSVTFSRPVKTDTLKGKIYLVDSSTGKRINCTVTGVDSTGKIVKVAPSQLLERGKEYYLVMDEGILAVDGAELMQGVLCRAKVRD